MSELEFYMARTSELVNRCDEFTAKCNDMRVQLDRMTELVNELRANQVDGRCKTCDYLRYDERMGLNYCRLLLGIEDNWVDDNDYCSRWTVKNET